MSQIFTSEWTFQSNNQQNNQNFSSYLFQNRTPFAEISSHIKGISNIQNNQPKSQGQKVFNDHTPIEKTYMFLKKKSHGIDINTYEEYEPLRGKEESELRVNKKVLNTKNQNDFSLSFNINEEEEKENNNFNNYENEINKYKSNKPFSFEIILKDTIDEKKSMDKCERDKKKALKLKQMKILFQNRKNIANNTNNEIKNGFINNVKNSENINCNKKDQLLYLAQNRMKETQSMNIEE